MSKPVLATQGLVKRFGGLLATDHLDMAVEAGELHAVIGPNGAGKTTLVKQLIGEYKPDEGRILLSGADITDLPEYRRGLLGISRSYQITSIFPDFTVLENVALAAQAHDGHSFGMWQPVAQDERLNSAAADALSRAGLLNDAERPAGALSHGGRRQLEIAMALVSRPKVLLLDEPLAGMGRSESEAMIQLLQSLKGKYSILLVEHDMRAVFTLADCITVLVYGRKIASGSAAEIRSSDEVRKAYLGDRHAAS